MIQASPNPAFPRPLRHGAPPMPHTGSAVLLAMAAAVFAVITVVHLSRTGHAFPAVDEIRMQVTGMSAGNG